MTERPSTPIVAVTRLGAGIRICLVAVFCAIACRNLLGEGSVAVLMADQAGYPLPHDAHVTIGTKFGYRNEDGVARVLDVPAGEYAVEAIAERYKPCFPMKVRVADGEEVSIVFWMQLEGWLGPSPSCVIPPMLPTIIEVTEPRSVTNVRVGKPVHIAWRIMNSPTNLRGWEIRILISGCHEAMGTWPLAAIPLETGRSSFRWTPGPKLVEWMQRCESLEGECEFPVDVSLYNAGARGGKPGSLIHDDDDVPTYHESCHPIENLGAYVYGSSVYGKGRLKARKVLTQ